MYVAFLGFKKNSQKSDEHRNPVKGGADEFVEEGLGSFLRES